jgi:glutamyl-tRNA reductase
MNLVLVGLNHKTAPVELREKLCSLFPAADAAYARLKALPALTEVVYYNTCNRVEVLAVAQAVEAGIQQLRDFFAAHPQVEAGELDRCLYVFQDEGAVRHLFRVAASLDAMVVGEPQILGQVKAAYRQGTECEATGAILNRLFHKTFSVAKKVRTETGLGDHAVSVSYAAVSLGKKIFGELTGKSALLIGAGEMGELALEHLRGQGVAAIIIANRTLSRAVRLAERFGGRAVSLEEVPEQLLHCDIIISSTGADQIILTQEQVKIAMRRRKQRPLFLIDIAVPRDLDPRINDLDNVYLYNIDDLREVVETNVARRQEAAVQAERLVAAEALKFMEWLKTLGVFPTIAALQEKAQAICQQEVKKTLAHLGPLTPEQIQALEVLTRSVANKLLHDPIIFLKRNHHSRRAAVEVNLVRRLFNLDPDPEEAAPESQAGAD